MKHSFNPCIAELKPSASVELMEKAKIMKSKGIDVISLAGGEPNFDTPARISCAAIKGMLSGNTHYVTAAGLLPLRERIAASLHDENAIACDSDNILVTPGGKFAIYAAVRTLLCPEDEVLIPTPSWVSYNAIVQAAGGVPVSLPLRYEDNYAITKDVLENACTPRTRLLIVNTPNNPTGRMVTQEEAQLLTAFAKEHELVIISDEIYSKLVYDGRRHISLASFPGAMEYVITVNGFSKIAAMTEWRVGYLCACKEIVKRIQKLYQHTMTCIPGFIQDAALEVFNCSEDVSYMLGEYTRRREAFITALNRIDGIEARMPEGAFYAWVRLKNTDMSSVQLADFLLEKVKVVGIPAAAFSSEDPCVRFSFAASKEELLAAAERISAAAKLLEG